jgi:hypothetical protein
MSYKRFLIFIILTISYSIVFSKNIPIDTIPFILEKDNRIYTYCKVNNSDSLYFLIDTGASDMVIRTNRLSKVKMNFDSELQNMGVTGTNTVKVSTNNIVNWGNQNIEESSFIAIPYQNEKWDGVLGLSILKRYVIKIDYDTKQIYLYNKDNYQAPNKKGLKITYKHNVPFVDVEIETIDNKNRTLSLELDTGSDRIIDISTSYVNSNKLLDVYTTTFATTKVSGSSDGNNNGVIYNVYFPKVEIADYELYKIPGGVAQIQNGIMNMNGVDGMIGNWFLKRFNLTFDFKNNYLYLEPNNYLHTRYFNFLTN